MVNTYEMFVSKIAISISSLPRKTWLTLRDVVIVQIRISISSLPRKTWLTLRDVIIGDCAWLYKYIYKYDSIYMYI